jgi:pyrimidine-nucleoside phosphorylase
VGDAVKKGESLVTIYSNSENVEDVKEKIRNAYSISSTSVDAPPLVYKKIK